jgi:peptide/nickel transport system permease protein
MAGFYRLLVRRSINLLIVLFLVLVLTVALLGETMDKILTDNIRQQVIGSLIESKIKFPNAEARQAYMDQQIELQIRNLGLDEPWYSPKRFSNTILKVLMLDLGRSYFFTNDNGSPEVKDIIAERVPLTLLLFTSATVITFIFGLYLGPYLAERYGKTIDKANVFVSMFSSSLPTFWVGMIMIYLFAFIVPIFPARSTPQSSPSDPLYIIDLLYHMALPLITLVILSIAVQSYFVRLFVVNILDEDFIRAKRAIGVPRKKILYSHALRNAAPPLLNSIIIGLAASFGGALLVETVFDWPGIGSLFYQAITVFDVPIIIGLVYVSTMIYIAAVFLTDLAYSAFDPRVKAIS